MTQHTRKPASHTHFRHTEGVPDMTEDRITWPVLGVVTAVVVVIVIALKLT